MEKLHWIPSISYIFYFPVEAIRIFMGQFHLARDTVYPSCMHVDICWSSALVGVKLTFTNVDNIARSSCKLIAKALDNNNGEWSCTLLKMV
jgi:hypothetical protein